MTEDQIERKCERLMDHLDRVFMSGSISQEDYNKAVCDLNNWADRQYSWGAALARAARRT